jgi:Flp pilus assembly protein TadG
MRPERRRSTRHRDSGTVAVGAAIGAHDRGAEAVEFALVVPIFLLLVFGIVDFGYMINHDTMVNNASREGAREGALNPTTNDIKCTVRRALTTLEPIGGAVDCAPAGTKIVVAVTCLQKDGVTNCVTPATDASGGTVIVTVTYQHSWITPVGSTIMPSGISLSKTTRMRIE